MTLQDIGSLGDIVVAVATVLTILYLAIQIRDNNKNTRAATSLSVNTALSSINSALRSDNEFTDIWRRGLSNLDSLDENETIRFVSHALEMLNLTIYVDQLEKQHLADLHIDYIPWITVLYRENPGFKAFVDSLKEEWSGPYELYARITNVELAKGGNPYK